MTSEQQSTHVVQEIQGVHLPVDNALYRNYPAMKLGHLHNIAFYSEYFLQFAIKLIAQSRETTHWVITAPAYYHLPAAANLLARKVHQLLSDNGVVVELLEPRLKGEQITIKNQQEFKSYYEYSKNNLAERTKERQRVNSLLDVSIAEQFANKSVIVINDISVTGTQQKFIQNNLTEWGAKQCYWFYIFCIEKTLAARHPEIEYQLNHCQINDLASFAEVLSNSNTAHTARCISRLFNEETANFKSLVGAIESRVRNKIYHLARLEGRYNSEFFQEKMQLLAGTETLASHG